MTLEVVGCAAEHQAANRAVAARPDDQDVYLLAEGSQLLARKAERRTALYAGQLAQAGVGFREDDVDALAYRGHQPGVGIGRHRDDFQRMDRGARWRSQFLCRRQSSPALGRIVVPNTDPSDRLRSEERR